MRKVWGLTLPVMLCGLLSACQQEEPVKSPASVGPNFPVDLYAHTADSLARVYHFNGIIALGYRDSLLFVKPYGLENFRTKKEIRKSSSFAIGSVSKQFTAVLALHLAESGKLRLKDTLRQFLGKAYSQFGQVTVHQLLTHTAGIHDGRPQRLSKPGEKYLYSNTGYHLLQQIIEKVSGKNYREVLEEFLQSKGLSGITTADGSPLPDFASAWVGNSQNAELVQDMPGRLASDQISIGAGGVIATAPSLVRWNYLLYSGRLLRPETLQQFLKIHQRTQHYLVKEIGYGYGLMYTLKNPAAFFHSGYVKGSASLNVYYPKSGISLVVLSNLADEAKGKDYVFRFHAEMFREASLLQHFDEKPTR